jgi:erythromycin 3''-O-methyltransferase
VGTKGLSLRRDLLIAARLIRFTTSSPANRARRLYELYGDNERMTNQTTYMNMGYWAEPGCNDLDEASRALVDLMADSARFKPGDRILDVGFGYADQDFYWMERHSPSQIVGVDVTPAHVRAANRQAKERHLEESLIFHEGSATALEFEFEPDSFDKVMAVECAFHFRHREDFFRQAYRVLRPGGVLATADMLPLDANARKDLLTRTIPQQNWYTGDSYAERLTAAGFVNVTLQSIGEDVYAPWRRYMLKKIEEPQFRRGVNGLIGKQFRRGLLQDAGQDLDYVIAVAEKPE